MGWSISIPGKFIVRACTTKQSRDGTISYQQRALAAVIVHPQEKEVLPIDFEPIICQDGAEKNDCERTAAKRLLESLAGKYPDLKMLLVEDALFATAPHIREVVGNGWNYIVNGTPDSHKSLFKQFAWRADNGQLRQFEGAAAEGGVKQFEVDGKSVFVFGGGGCQSKFSLV